MDQCAINSNKSESMQAGIMNCLVKNKIITDEYRLNGEDPEKIYLNGISEK